MRENKKEEREDLCIACHVSALLTVGGARKLMTKGKAATSCFVAPYFSHSSTVKYFSSIRFHNFLISVFSLR